MNVGLFASLDDLIFSNLFSGNVSTESDIKSNSSCVEGRFLRDERDGATVRLNVQVGDVLTIDDDSTGERIAEKKIRQYRAESSARRELDSLEALNELDSCGLSGSTGSYDRSELARFDFDVESPQNSNVRTSRVTEVNVLESDVSLRSVEVELVSRGIFSIDVGTRVDEMDESLSTSSRFRHVGNE